MLAGQLAYRLRTAGANARNTASTPQPLVGDAIFEGTDYPRTWDGFVGQSRCKAQLRAASLSARMRGARMDHVLLASGVAGIGKTSLAKLIAADYGTGIVEVSGQVSIDDVRPILQGMQDNDFLFIDEIHQLVQGGKAKAEWLLHLLQDGNLVTKRGVEVMPKVTIVAATTDAQKLPDTILGRFKIKPVLEPYTVEESVTICTVLARKIGFGTVVPEYHDLAPIAAASNGNPRDMATLLIALRDSYFHHGEFSLPTAMEWVGVSHDGLDRLAQDYLLILLLNGVAGEKQIGSQLGEPGGLRHTEKLLMQKGYINITSKGRELTEAGVGRCESLVLERDLCSPDPEVTRNFIIA